MKKNFRKAVSVFLCVLLVCMMSVTAFAADFTGSGTKADPYVIKTAADIDTLSAKVAAGEDFSGKYFILLNNITVSNSFAPIGTKDKAFSGNFDGNGKTVSGLNVQSDYAALFANCKNAVISSVTVSGTLFAENYAGAVVAYAENTVIEKCICSAGVYADNYAGGIVGYIESGKITDCATKAAADIGGYVDKCGGIAGFSGADIIGCKNDAYVSGAKDVGGIAGHATGTIVSCANTALIQSGESNFGGIAGLTEGEIKFCENKGRISADGTGIGKAGGIAGVGYQAVIEECISSGVVTASGNYAGGIAGYLTDGNVKNCIAAANVSTSASFAGGIFGYSLRTKVSECIYTATVSATSSTDAAIGAVSGGTVNNCYYNSNNETKTVCTGSATNTVGVPAAAIKVKNSYTALDFNSIWIIDDTHAEYPLLQGIPFHTLNVSETVEASCTVDGIVSGICTGCTKNITIVTPAYGHTFTTVSSKAATCTTAGYVDKLCSVCNATETDDIPATGHTDADADKECDVCKADLTEKQPSAEKNIFEKIADFFKRILEWIKNLFS